MPAALDDEAQAMGAGEIKCRGDVGCSLGSDDIGARDRTPGVQPAGALVQPRLAPEIKGIGEELSHRRISAIGQGDRRPPTARLRASHSAALGQPGMPGLAQLGATVAVGAARGAAAPTATVAPSWARPGMPGWPSAAEWDALNRAVGGRRSP